MHKLIIGDCFCTHRESTDWTERQCRCVGPVMQWLQLRFDFDSTGVRRTFDCLSKVIQRSLSSQWR